MTLGTVAYPAVIDSSTTLFDQANIANSTLNASCTSGDTTLTLVSVASFPTSGVISIENEIIFFLAKSGATLTGCLRGQEGTAAAAHANAVPVYHRATARQLTVLRDAIIALELTVGSLGQNIGGQRNLLDNGSLDIWQRGNGPFTAHNVIGPDRWTSQNGGASTHSCSKETGTVDVNSTISAALTYTHAASGYTVFQQPFEDISMVQGKTIALTGRVKSSVAGGTLRIDLYCGGGAAPPTFTSSNHTNGGAWETLTAIGTIPLDTTALVIRVIITAGTGTYYLDNFMLVYGAEPSVFVPMSPCEELARCQRWYEVHGGLAYGYPRSTGYQAAGQNFLQSFGYQVSKKATPTVTKNGTWALTNIPTLNPYGATKEGYCLYGQAAALGTTGWDPDSTDDCIISEAS